MGLSLHSMVSGGLHWIQTVSSIILEAPLGVKSLRQSSLQLKPEKYRVSPLH
ncbi:hypothetical protein SAMN05443507_11168 [Alicyclobacillus tolerans]|uniref:Uncharacterized protein n=1 Tax=Alicyclobacillus tolerans TaxID=90970 RepID=A0A1M6R667_9BACL|nr:hypothetical protein SAMN05443507_11168 [Alicyclobacillus montanus]